MRLARLFLAARRINIGCAYLSLLFAAVLCVGFALGSALKVGSSVLVQALVLAGFLTIPFSGPPNSRRGSLSVVVFGFFIVWALPVTVKAASSVYAPCEAVLGCRAH